MEINNEDQIFLKLVNKLQNLQLPRQHLETYLIILLKWMYNNDESKITKHLEHWELVSKPSTFSN